MPSRPTSSEGPWASATWEGAESQVLAAGARLSLPERLRWLEGAARAARQLATGRPVGRSVEQDVAEPEGVTGDGVAASGRLAALSLCELLEELGGARLRTRKSDGVLAVAWLDLAGGRSLLVVERTYREGIRILLDPTASESEALSAGRLWDLWNSDRAALLAGAI